MKKSGSPDLPHNDLRVLVVFIDLGLVQAGTIHAERALAGKTN